MCTRQPPHADCPAYFVQPTPAEREAQLWSYIGAAFRMIDPCDGRCDPSALCIPCTLERPSPKEKPAPVIIIAERDVLASILSAND